MTVRILSLVTGIVLVVFGLVFWSQAFMPVLTLCRLLPVVRFFTLRTRHNDSRGHTDYAISPCAWFDPDN